MGYVTKMSPNHWGTNNARDHIEHVSCRIYDSRGETCNSRMGYHWIKKNCADLRQCRAGSGCLGCFFKEVQNSVFHCVPTFIEKMASRNWSCACQFHDDIPPQVVILFKRNPSFPGQFGMLDKQLTITRLVSSSQFIFQPSSSKNMMASATHAG